MRGRVLSGVVLAALAGCGGGGGGGGGEQPKPQPVTAQQVIDHVQRETGATLHREPVVANGLVSLNSRGTRLGSFVIYVTGDSADARRIWKEGSGGHQLGPPDPSGVVWIRECPPKQVRIPCFYMGNRLFGANVVLSWISRRDRRVTPQFRRVMDVLEGLSQSP